MADIASQIHRLLAPVRMRIASVLARAVVTLVNDRPRVQRLQLRGIAVEDGHPEITEDGEHFLPYGLLSVPHAGAEAVVLFPGGDREHPLVVAVTDRRSRPRGGQPGEAGVYTDEGDEIRLARGHVVVIKTSGEIRAGGASATTPVALSSELAALKSAIDAWTPMPGDGGASLKAVFTSWDTPGATKLKAE